MRDIKDFLYLFILIDLFLLAFSIYKGEGWVINSQLAFLSSLLISVSSFFAYRKNVLSKLKKGDIPITDERDELDKIDDKFDLFSEEEEERSPQEISRIIKEEKRKRKGFKNTLLSLKTSLPSFLSPLRFLAYLFLIGAFFYLNRHHLLNVFAFLSGLFVVPLGILLYFLISSLKR